MMKWMVQQPMAWNTNWNYIETMFAIIPMMMVIMFSLFATKNTIQCVSAGQFATFYGAIDSCHSSNFVVGYYCAIFYVLATSWAFIPTFLGFTEFFCAIIGMSIPFCSQRCGNFSSNSFGVNFSYFMQTVFAVIVKTVFVGTVLTKRIHRKCSLTFRAILNTIVGKHVVSLTDNVFLAARWSQSTKRLLFYGIAVIMSISSGSAWGATKFAIGRLPAPTKATVVYPSDGVTDRNIETQLSWTTGLRTTSYKVYFGTDATPDGTEYIGEQTEPNYNPGTLTNEATYYWRIDSVNHGGTTTGDVWSFTTFPPPEPEPEEGYYVDGLTGSNDNNGLSLAKAWADMTPVGATPAGSTINISNMDATITEIDWPDRIYESNTISQYGFTWTFNEPCQIGQFANHDMWVKAPTSIIMITPSSSLDAEGVTRHGSMINPDPTATVGTGPWPWSVRHAFDSRMPAIDTRRGFTASLNAGRPGGNTISAENPIVISSDSSLVSAWSFERQHGGWSAYELPVQFYHILTALTTVPAYGSFRPTPYGTDKTIHYNKTDINTAHLGNYTILGEGVAGAPAKLLIEPGDDPNDWDLSYERMVQRTWFDIGVGIDNCYNLSTYNRWMTGNFGALTSSGVGLILNTSKYTIEQKMPVIIGMCQAGIDLYGVVDVYNTTGRKIETHFWYTGAEVGWGRAFPVYFAGIMLDDTSRMGDIGSNPLGFCPFAENNATYYVSSANIYTPPYAIGSVSTQWSTTNSNGKAYVTHGSTTVEIKGYDLTTKSGTFQFGIKDDSIAYDPDGKAYSISSIDYDLDQLTLSAPYDGNTSATSDGNDYIIAGIVYYGHCQTASGGEHGEEWVSADLGLPAWGQYHYQTIPDSVHDVKDWECDYSYMPLKFAGAALAIMMMNSKSVWNWDALFDHLDRYWAHAHIVPGDNPFAPTWSNRMWEAYRDGLGDVWEP